MYNRSYVKSFVLSSLYTLIILQIVSFNVSVVVFVCVCLLFYLLSLGLPTNNSFVVSKCFSYGFLLTLVFKLMLIGN